MDPKTMFAIYFASLAGIARHHPGAGKGTHKVPNLIDLAQEASKMVTMTEFIFATEKHEVNKWQSQSEQ